jgi:hypothetical protein
MAWALELLGIKHQSYLIKTIWLSNKSTLTHRP